MTVPQRRTLIIAFLAFLIVFEAIAYAATTPPPREEFFQLYVLGSGRTLSGYYPNDDPNIPMKTLVRWYLGVTNFMGSVQLVAIRLKLGNQTTDAPDENSALPSDALFLREFRRFLLHNETWEFPLTWTVSEADKSNSSVRIFELHINDETYRIPDVAAVNGYNFRFIIELWTWRVESGSWELGWLTRGERRVAWLQLWFNMTISGP